MPNLQAIKDFGALVYFERCGIAGGICASFAHTILVPLDVLKTRIQIDPEKYHRSFAVAYRSVIKEEGMFKLLTGLTPTTLGYFAQGFMKFSIFEGLKYEQYKLLGTGTSGFVSYLITASMAEVIATICLCPFEAVRIRSLMKPTSPIMTAKRLMSENKNPILPFYKGIVPILAKQVPYTATQLSVFSVSIKKAYSLFYPNTPTNELSHSTQLGVTGGCGVFAGAIASIMSHPADTIFTQMNSSKQSLTEVVKRIKFRGMWAGVVPRCVMTSMLSGVMFLIYDSVRLLVKLPASH